MAQIVQGSGGGWATSKLVGSLRRIPTTSQKWLRGKMINLITTSSIKRS